MELCHEGLHICKLLLEAHLHIWSGYTHAIQLVSICNHSIQYIYTSAAVGFQVGSDDRVFNNIQELIFHFKSTHDILCCKLTDACPRSINSPSVLEIDQSSLVLLERLYISEMDDIWYGIWLNDGKKIPVHIRRLSPQLNSKDNVLQEKDITRRLLHDNIVQLYGISTSKVPMYIISECMKK